MLFLASGVGAASGAGFLAWAVRGRSASVFGRSVWRGDIARRTIALTFDDGPSESTPALLKILDRHRVSATFFMCGRNVERCASVAREVFAAGHEIGNHSDSHPRFDFKSGESIYRELESAQEKIHAATGAIPRWFRAPYGVRWFGLDAAQKRLGLTGAMWTVIGRDWRWPADRVAERLVAGARNGAILCVHDGRVLEPKPDIRATLEAVEIALPQLRKRFEFVTLSGMFSGAKTPVAG